jgi:hypothetical protein
VELISGRPRPTALRHDRASYHRRFSLVFMEKTKIRGHSCCYGTPRAVAEIPIIFAHRRRRSWQSCSRPSFGLEFGLPPATCDGTLQQCRQSAIAPKLTKGLKERRMKRNEKTCAMTKKDLDWNSYQHFVRKDGQLHITGINGKIFDYFEAGLSVSDAIEKLRPSQQPQNIPG